MIPIVLSIIIIIINKSLWMFSVWLVPG